MLSKSRVSPLKPITVPRLELNASVLATRCSVMLKREFKFGVSVKHFFYTDSTVVLGYISNSTRRYQTFVANRVGTIQSLTTVSQWSHVSGKENPADFASRGCSPEMLSNSIWFEGPSLLHKESLFEHTPLYYPIPEGDENVRKNVVSHAVKVEENFYVERLSHISSYSRLFRVVAICLNWVKGFRSKIRSARDVLSVLDLEDAKIRVVRLVQTPLHSVLPNLQQFSPYVDDKGVIRVGGRLSRMPDSVDFKHPIILPKNALFTSLVVRHSHCLQVMAGKVLH